MPASIWRNWLSWAILTACLAGCQSFSKPQGLPQDPLFISKKPMEARAELAPPIACAYLEPSLPTDPYLAKNGRPVSGTLTNRSKDGE